MQVLGRVQEAQPKIASPHADTNRNVGRFVVRYLDREDGVPYTMHQEFVTGGGVGARTGYETLASAMREVAELTRGDAIPAAAILERHGRYYARTLKVRDLERGLRSPLETLHLEADARAAVRELRNIGGTYERLRAIVDGAWARRIRARRG